MGINLFAVWNDGVAVDFDPGDIIHSDISPILQFGTPQGLMFLYGFEQELIASSKNGDLVIRDFLLMDYPIFIRLSK